MIVSIYYFICYFQYVQYVIKDLNNNLIKNWKLEKAKQTIPNQNKKKRFLLAETILNWLKAIIN